MRGRSGPRAARGWRPSSAIRAAMSAWKFGWASSMRADPRQVLGAVRHVRADERRRRVTRHQRLERVDHRVERGEPLPVAEPPVGVLEQLLQPFVVRVDRLEERHRIGHVDRDGESQVGGGVPQRDRVARRRASPTPPPSSRTWSPSTFHTFIPRAPAPAARRSWSAIHRSERAATAGLLPVDVGERRRSARGAPGRNDRGCPPAPARRPSRLTIARTLRSSISASSAPTSGAAQSEVSHRPRWRARRRPGSAPAPPARSRGAQSRARVIVAQTKVAERGPVGGFGPSSSPSSDRADLDARVAEAAQLVGVGVGVGDHLVDEIEIADAGERDEPDLRGVRDDDDAACALDQREVRVRLHLVVRREPGVVPRYRRCPGTRRRGSALPATARRVGRPVRRTRYARTLP